MNAHGAAIALIMNFMTDWCNIQLIRFRARIYNLVKRNAYSTHVHVQQKQQRTTIQPYFPLNKQNSFVEKHRTNGIMYIVENQRHGETICHTHGHLIAVITNWFSRKHQQISCVYLPYDISIGNRSQNKNAWPHRDVMNFTGKKKRFSDKRTVRACGSER